MSPLRSSVAALAAGALLLFACGDDDDASGTEDPEATTDDAGSTGDEGEGDEGEDADGGDVEARDDVPSGVAATVGATEITIDTFEAIYEDIAGSSAIAPQLEGEQGEAMTPALRAQILSQLVVQEILVQGAAEDFSVEVGDDDVEAALDQFESDAGGSDEFDAQLEESGLTREAFMELELRLAALLEELEAEFGELSPNPDAPDETPEGQAALQEWASSKFADADVAVAAEYGTWAPEAGNIQPPS